MKFWSKIILFIQLLLYIIFLYLDIKGEGSHLSSKLKFISTLLCLILVLLSRDSWYDERDGRLVSLALSFTVLADVILLFTVEFHIGIVIFCVTHLLWLHRYGVDLLAPGAILAFAVMGSLIIKSYELRLVVLALIYGILIISVTIAAKKSELPIPAKRLAFVGMVLFLLCDVNVFLFNALESGNTLYYYVSVGMWLFYLPSQVLLALSSIKLKHNIDDKNYGTI